jgi:hypothetical protein
MKLSPLFPVHSVTNLPGLYLRDGIPLGQRRIPLDVHASPDELPELKRFSGAFQGCYRCPEGADTLERSRTGLPTELPHKHRATIPHAVPGTSAQCRQEVLTNMRGMTRTSTASVCRT